MIRILSLNPAKFKFLGKLIIFNMVGFGLGEVHGFEPPSIDELQHDVSVMTQWYDAMAAVHAQNNKTIRFHTHW